MRRHQLFGILAPLPSSALVSALIACALLLLPALVLANTAPILSDSEQAALSTAVVVAEIHDTQLGEDQRWGRAVARTSVRIVEVLSGAAPSTLVVEQFVGRQGGQLYRIPGDAKLEPGEHCVLFLREVTGRWYLTAMQLSKYSILSSPLGQRVQRVVSDGIFGTGNAEPNKGTETDNLASMRTLDDLRHRLGSAATISAAPEAEGPEVEGSGLSSGGDA